MHLFLWPPRSPGSTPYDFYLELRNRIINAEFDVDILRLVWSELDYRLDVGRFTRGAHIENLRELLHSLVYLNILVLIVYTQIILVIRENDLKIIHSTKNWYTVHSLFRVFCKLKFIIFSLSLFPYFFY
ncbi:hypothetical protein C0J52_15653 [Blattella germanica]|nr:hypothetical protein C0J52_15653 [Blattella germanica]